MSMEKQQFEQIVMQYKDRLFAIAFHTCKNAADADDIVQTVLLKYYQSQKTFLTKEHIRNWLIRVTINECKKVLISPWKKHTVPLEEYAGEVFDRKEESDLFLAVISLPKKYRIVVHLYYYEDYSVQEIAEILSRKETTVQTQLMRARQKLKEQLKEAWNDAA